MSFFNAFLFCVAAYTIGRMNGIMTETEKRDKLQRDIDSLWREVRELRKSKTDFGYKGK